MSSRQFGKSSLKDSGTKLAAAAPTNARIAKIPYINGKLVPPYVEKWGEIL